VEPEEKRGQCVDEADDDDPERAGGDDGEPHQRDELERVSELTHGVGQVGATEVWLGKQDGGDVSGERFAA
jgi:hypothetical protein